MTSTSSVQAVEKGSELEAPLVLPGEHADLGCLTGRESRLSLAKGNTGNGAANEQSWNSNPDLRGLS